MDSLLRQETVVVPATGIVGDVRLVVVINAASSGLLEESSANNAAMSDSSVTLQNWLSLHAERSQILETDGQRATRVFVTRYGDIAAALPVALQASDANEIAVPATLSIPAGVQSVAFWVDAIRDNEPDLNAPVTLQATANGCLTGETVITVVNTDIPSLTLRLSANSATEGEVLSATVESNLTADQDVIVSLISAAAREFDLPASVIIPAGQRSVTFQIPVKDDAYAELETVATLRLVLAGTTTGT